jgi:hypothetical protein
VRQGKVIELDLATTDPAAAEAEVRTMCEKLLANTVIEKYTVEIGDAGARPAAGGASGRTRRAAKAKAAPAAKRKRGEVS